MTVELESRLQAASEIHVPAPVLRDIGNETGFPHLAFDKMGPGRRFHDVVILSGSFVFGNGILTRADVQRGPSLADIYWDELDAEISSLKVASDVVLYKPGTDVYITGTAHTYQCKPKTEWLGALRVTRGNKSLISKALNFTGPRGWNHSLLSGWRLSKAIPTGGVVLRYEHAYGGSYSEGKGPNLQRRVYPQNPSGSGLFGSSHDTRDMYLGPQVEYPNEPIQKSNRHYTPAGFGPIARFWQPRLQHAGTYDADWHAQYQATSVPDYPSDFDFRFFQNAPVDQVVVGYLNGNESLELGGMFEDQQSITMSLPNISFEALCHDYNLNYGIHPFKLDTVHVDLDTRCVHLCWRLVIDHSAGVQSVQLRQSMRDSSS